MVQVSYPGVYIEEVPSGVRTITGVSTSIGAFMGRATKGPIDKAVRLLSYADYERTFGAPHDKSKLAKAVEMFFNNGGSDCYVVRLAKNPAKATVTLGALRDLSVAGAGQEVLEFEAKAAGLWANTVRLEIDYNTSAPEETFNLRVIHEDAGEIVASEDYVNLSMDATSPRFVRDFVNASSELVNVKLASGLGDPADGASTYNADTFNGFSKGGRPYSTTATDVATTFNTEFFGNDKTSLRISVNGSMDVTVDLSGDGALPDTDHATIAGKIEQLINDRLSSELSPAQAVTCEFAPDVPGVGRYLVITADTTGVENKSVRIKRAPSNDIAAAMMLSPDQGGLEPTRWSNFRPAPTASILPIGDPNSTAAAGYVSYASQDLPSLPQDTANGNAITFITIDGTTVDLSSGDYMLETLGATALWFQDESDEPHGVREKLKLIADAINNTSSLQYRAEVWGYQLALTATDGTINKTPTISTTNASLGDKVIANVRQYTLGKAGNGGAFADGTDGEDGDPPEQDEYLGREAQQTGMHALDSVDLFNLMALPEDEEVDLGDVWGPASVYCKNNRAFLLIDPPADWTDNDNRPAVIQDTSKINSLRLGLENDHAAVFYPHIKYSDGGKTRTMGPAAAIAGLMARIDGSRGVWKAPAGVEAGLTGVTGLTVDLTDMENGVLNKRGVNCLRVFPTGLVNWGGRTLDGDDDFGSEWKYIPVRRLALNMEESLYRGTRWVVFELNKETTWADIRLNINAYMMSLFRQGAFQGTSPKNAFFVKCDKDTTTQNDINKGIVNIVVGFAPAKPAEFVVIKIQQMVGDL